MNESSAYWTDAPDATAGLPGDFWGQRGPENRTVNPDSAISAQSTDARRGSEPVLIPQGSQYRAAPLADLGRQSLDTGNSITDADGLRPDDVDPGAKHPNRLRRWISSLLGHVVTGDIDFDTSRQNDHHIPDDEDTVGKLSAEHATGATGRVVSPVDEKGPTVGGAHRLGRDGSIVGNTGNVDSGGNLKDRGHKLHVPEGAKILGGAALRSGTVVGGWFGRQVCEFGQDYGEAARAYIDSIVAAPARRRTAPGGAGLPRRLATGIGNMIASPAKRAVYAIWKPIGTIVAYASPPIAAVTGPAMVADHFLDLESIDERYATAVYMVSGITALATYFRGRRLLSEAEKSATAGTQVKESR